MSAILLFIENDTQVYWSIVDQGGERISSISVCSLAEVSELVEDHRVIIFIRSNLVNQFTTYIPSSHHQKLMQAIPFAIENQVAESVDSLHFTYYEAQPKQQVVTVISKDILNDLLNKLDEYAIRPDKIYPTFIALPYKPSYWTLLISSEEIILNIGPYQGYAFSEDEMGFMLEKLFKLHTAPSHFRIFLACIYDTAALIELMQKYNIAYYIDDRTNSHPLNIYAANFQNMPDTNLLQTSYVSKHKLLQTKKYMLAAAILFCGSIFSMSLRAGLIYKDLSHKNLQYKHAIQQYARTLYPTETPTIGRLKGKVSKEFSSLSTRQNYPLLDTLKIITKVNQNTRLKINEMNYAFSEIKLSVQTTNPEYIDKMINLLSQYHVTAEQSQYKLSGKDVLAELSIKIHD